MTCWIVLRRLAAACLLAAASLGTAAADGVPRLTADQLAARLDDPAVAVIDVRSPGDWNASDAQIRGAVRRDPGAVAAWAGNYRRDQTLVLYCA